MESKEELKGTLLVIEGVDGAGKSTVVSLLHDKIQRGMPEREVVRLRTPDGPIRDVLLNRTGTIRPEAELLLYISSHAYVLDNQILPALARGAIVILDRFYWSTLSYQGFGRKLLNMTQALIEDVIKPPTVDHLIFVDAPLEVCEERLKARGAMDFMDLEAQEFKHRTRAGMLSLMEHEERRGSHFFHRILNNEGLPKLDNRVQSWVDHFILNTDDWK